MTVHYAANSFGKYFYVENVDNFLKASLSVYI